LSRVILSPEKSLKRIYILDDNLPQKAVKEFATLKREMQYYLDYFRFDISELSGVLDPLGERKDAKNEPSLFQPNIEVYVTTAKILRDIAIPWVNKKVLKSIVVQTAESETITHVDFICSSTGQKNGGMIYNFLNQRADPGELVFLAYLFRDKFNVAREKEILFESLDELRGEPKSKDATFRNLQLQHRKDTLRKSIKRYVDESEFPEAVKQLASNVDAVETEEELLKIRAALETALFKHFEGRFSYLFEFLKYASLKVNFFAKPGLRRIEKVSPFAGCKSMRALENRIRDSLRRKKIPWPTYDENKQCEAVIFEPKIKHDVVPTKPKIFFNYADLDQPRVLEIYNRLSEEGFAAWLDKKNLRPGDDWRQEINKAIKASSVFVACFSRNYLSGDGFRYAELREAMERAKEMAFGHKYIIPIRLDYCEIPEEISSELQYIDVFDNDGGWDEDNWKRFSDTLRQELKSRGIKLD
jgi:hypothetical protein